MDKQTQAVAAAVYDFLDNCKLDFLGGFQEAHTREGRNATTVDGKVDLFNLANSAIKASGAEHLVELVRALEPFAYFIEQYKRQPFRNQDDVYVSIHLGSEFEAKIRLSDMEKASEALSKLPPELRGK